MNASIDSKINLYARRHGISYHRAASDLAKRSAAKRRAKARRKDVDKQQQEKFERMKASRPDLY